MGLDKKTTSPKPRKERSSEKREELKKGEGKLRRSKEYLTPRRRDKEGSKASASVIFSAQDLNAEVDEVRTAVEEMERKGKPGQDVWEVDQENIFKYGKDQHQVLFCCCWVKSLKCGCYTFAKLSIKCCYSVLIFRQLCYT